MKRKIVLIIIAILITLAFWLLPANIASVKGGYAHGAEYRQIYHQDWQSVEHFTEWYKAQHFTLLMPSGSYTVDCDDYAEWVIDKALRQGYSVSSALTWNGRYYNKRVTDLYTSTQPGHVGGLVLIKGTYYYFEPQIDKFKGLTKIIERD